MLQGDMSSLATASDSEIVKAARADANAYYETRKKAGKPVDFSSAYMYASGRAIQRDLTDSLKQLTYTNAFNSVIEMIDPKKRGSSIGIVSESSG